MRKSVLIGFISLLGVNGNLVLSQQIDGYVPASTDRDQRQVSGTNVPAVFVYSSGDALNSGAEAPLPTCTPQTMTLKGPSGEDITSTTVCEKVNVATNPDKNFTVSAICDAIAPSTMSATCTATNNTPSWTNVSMIVTPRLDNQPVANWASIFCNGCTWQWVQTSNNCNSSATNTVGRQLAHNFAGNPTATCASVGVFRVTDPETNKSWDSLTINARLAPTPIARNHVLTNQISVGPQDELYGPTSSQSMDATASITLAARLDGLAVGSWPSSPIYCPACTYSHIVTNNSCSNVSISGASTIASHNVDSGACSFNLVMTVTDPETLWTVRLPASGSYAVNLRKKPPTCLPATRTQWVSRSSSCNAGYAGSNTFEDEQRSNFICDTPYSAGYWSPWVDTGQRRNFSSTCAIICVPESPQTKWTAQSQGCPSGQTGTITWEAEERRTSSCPSYTGYPVWSGYSFTGNTRNNVNSCQTLCSPLATQYQWVSASSGCPSGQLGSITWEKQQANSSSCPSSTGSPVWSGWYDTGTTRNNVSSCQASCSPLATQYQWVSASSGCSSGQVGSITWEKQQANSSSCPSSTGSPVWSGWYDTGTTRNLNNTCQNVGCPINPGTQTTRWVDRSAACPSGQTGSHTWQQQQVAYYGSYPSCSYGAWQDTAIKQNESNTCKVSTPVCPFQAITHTYEADKINETLPTTQYGKSYEGWGSTRPGQARTCGKYKQLEWNFKYSCVNGSWSKVFFDAWCSG